MRDYQYCMVSLATVSIDCQPGVGRFHWAGPVKSGAPFHMVKTSLGRPGKEGGGRT